MNKAANLVDKSWGVTPSSGFRIRTNASPDQRAAERASAREMRAQERVAATAARTQARAVDREVETRAREQAREARREDEMKRADADPHAAAARRHRSSGRKDVVREQRDTRGYTTVVDVTRMRALASRGATVTGLAGAFGISVEEVERALASAE